MHPPMAQPQTYELQQVHAQEQGSGAEDVRPKSSRGFEEPQARPVSAASSITVRDVHPASTQGARTIQSHYSRIPVNLFLLYAAITLYPWIIFCIARGKPIGSQVGYHSIDEDNRRADLSKILSRHENHLKAAEIVRTVGSLLTVPITSAICSVAAVSFMQTGRLRLKLTLSQAAALADQGWLSPRVWTKLSALGSLPLYIAFALTLFGSVFHILQASFVTTEPIRVSQKIPNIVQIVDVPFVLNSSRTGRDIAHLRSLLETSSHNDIQSHLWAEDETAPSTSYIMDYSAGQNHRGKPLGVIRDSRFEGSEPPSFYFSPLVANFSTGVYPGVQHAPRISTTIEYINISSEGLPSECNANTDGIFFAEYHATHPVEARTLDLVACMPADLRSSPWEATYDRQDITEVFYIKTVEKIPYPDNEVRTAKVFKATAKTSLGYFQLQSVNNGYRTGPLLDTLAVPPCDKYCYNQDPFRRHKSKRQDDTPANDTTSDIDHYTGNLTLTGNNNNGPLAAIAMALFGQGSFIDTHLSNPSAFTVKLPQYEDLDHLDQNGNPRNISISTGACVGLYPMYGIRSDSFTGSGGPYCLRDSSMQSEKAVVYAAYDWGLSFTEYDSQADAVQRGLERASFLANKLWLGVDTFGSDSRHVLFDEGLPTVKPSISVVGMIVGSVFLAVHLFGLLVLSIYAFVFRPWVPSLGSEVMIRMGAAYGDVLSAAEGERQWKQTLEACPGFIGDERPNEHIGRLVFGAPAGLNARNSERRFERPL